MNGELNHGKDSLALIARGRWETTTYKTKCEWKQIMKDRRLSVDDIAAYLGIKRDTVYRWISERNMPGHKIGRLWKFNKMKVDEWVRGGAKHTKSKEEE